MEDHNYKEELKKAHQLVANLEQGIHYKNKQLSDMQFKYDDALATSRKLISGLTEKIIIRERRHFEVEQMYLEKISSRDGQLLKLQYMYHETSATVKQLMKDKTELYEIYVEEIRKEKSANIKLKNEMKLRERELEQRSKELEECKASNDLERRRLLDQLEELKLKLENQNPTESGSDLNAQIIELRNQLEEKTDSLQDSQSLNHTLTLKELMSNQELQAARKEAITGLQRMLNSRTTLAIKRMGEIDKKAFQKACLLKFSDGKWEEISTELCSLWEEYVKNPHWHPFKRVINKGNPKEVIDDDDEKLKELRDEYGEAVYEAVTTALLQLNEYNPSGRYPVPEIWNMKEDKRATLKEIIQYLIKQLKTNKRKR